MGRVMNSILVWIGLLPSDEEKKTLRHVRLSRNRSMKVVGRGTLTMDAKDARSTPKAKKFMANVDSLVE